MAFIARSLLAAAGLAAMSCAALAQGYDADDTSEPLIERTTTPSWGGGYPGGMRTYGLRPHRHARADLRAYRLATPQVAMRGYGAVALPPAAPVAYTLPTRAIYAEPTPRAVYYNEPTVIVDGLRTHRAAMRVGYDRCGYGCLRAAY